MSSGTHRTPVGGNINAQPGNSRPGAVQTTRPNVAPGNTTGTHRPLLQTTGPVTGAGVVQGSDGKWHYNSNTNNGLTGHRNPSSAGNIATPGTPSGNRYQPSSVTSSGKMPTTNVNRQPSGTTKQNTGRTNTTTTRTPSTTVNRTPSTSINRSSNSGSNRSFGGSNSGGRSVGGGGGGRHR